jgi:tungstate transport system substrate-binding protein
MLTCLAALALASMPATSASIADPPAAVLRLATTTSTVDTGLLTALLPEFQSRCGCHVDVIAVGTGQALELGRRGDADVLLVHAPDQEAAFVAEGHAARRDDVMYNDFVIVGPLADAAGIAQSRSARDAFRLIAAAGATFASRGDKSGTHTKELAIWKALGQDPARAPAPGLPWYLSVGQGMGETLALANEKPAYTLSDRATWTSMHGRLPNLRQLFGGASSAENPDRDLRNQYSVIAVDPARHPGVNGELAGQFAVWLLSKPTQQRIGAFGRDGSGHSLFYPDSEEFKATNEVRVVIGSHARTFTLADLQAVKHVTLAGHEEIGTKKGRLGRFSWTGANLRDLLLAVDPGLASRTRSGSTIEVVSSDGWAASLTWDELFGQVSEGEGLYRAKGCNECHGVRAEGTSPAGKRPAPKLAGVSFPAAATAEMIHAGVKQHAGIKAYTPDRISDRDLAAILGWLAKPGRASGTNTFTVPPESRMVLLAYERDGTPITGREGLIQLVVGFDQFAARYSHWVAEVRVR